MLASFFLAAILFGLAQTSITIEWPGSLKYAAFALGLAVIGAGIEHLLTRVGWVKFGEGAAERRHPITELGFAALSQGIMVAVMLVVMS